MATSHWYDLELSQQILKQRYMHPGEKTPEEFMRRVASVMPNKRLRENVYKYLEAGFICPAGRTLYAAGAKSKFRASLSNCYIIPSPEDNLESIFQSTAEMARIFSYGGGVGVNISNLRPKDSKVNNAARTSTGAVSFLKLFDGVGEVISQNGRRGAMMVALDCKHPDLYEFLRIKQNNEKLASMNISILFHDDFMKAVEEKKPYTLSFKIEATGETIEKTIDAASFFDEYCKTQWDWGDPGALFIDKIRKHTLLSGYDEYKIEVTNPCVVGDTLILTDKGNLPIKDLVGKKVNIWNGFEWSEVIPKITGHHQKMLRVTFNDGSSIDCTIYHKFILDDGSRISAKDLTIKHKLAKFHYPIIEGKKELESAYTMGVYAGDGTIDLQEIAIYKPKKCLLKHLEDVAAIKEQPNQNRYLVKLNKQFSKTFVPQTEYSVKSRLQWLAGLIDTDGTRNSKDGCISISSIDKDFLFNIKYMLITLGCKSTLSIVKEATTKLMPNGNKEDKEYYCQTAYRLAIPASSMIYLKQLGLITFRVNTIVNPNRNVCRYIIPTNIESIEDAETVYCVTEPKNHSVVFNGIMTGNCGEFGGNAYNSCNLMSINMYNCVSNKFTNNAYFDCAKLKKAVFVAVEALDSILDYGYDLQPLDQNRTCIDNWRSVGLGIMGFADALVALKIRYGSIESQQIAEKITKTMLLAALEQSMRIAAKKGPFKKFEIEKTLQSPLLKLVNAHKYCVPDPETGLSNHTLLTLIKKYGLRNGTLLSIAPTGTISLLMGQFSGGCEPLYKISYQRTSHKMEDEGKSFKVYAHSVADLLEAKGIDPEKITDDEIKKRFPWIIESHDINPMGRIKVQAALQKYVDNSISSTVNLRHEATPEEIREIYMAAWKNQCKGITVFRDGCKRGNLLGVAPKKKEEKVTVKTTSQDAKANKKIPATISYNSIVPIHRSSSVLNGQTIIKHTSCVDKMYITVNQLENGDIFEIFTNVSGGCQSNIGTITRLASLALRSGIKVPEVIKQLVKVKCPACQALIRKGRKDISLSCGNAIGSALQEVYSKIKHPDRPTISIPHKEKIAIEEFDKQLESISEQGCANCHNAECSSKDEAKMDITTGENSTINRQCPECGKYTLRPEGNCVTCSYCGWSKCE